MKRNRDIKGRFVRFECELCEDTGVIDEMCGRCSGSGEGMVDGSRCVACKGRGVLTSACKCREVP